MEKGWCALWVCNNSPVICDLNLQREQPVRKLRVHEALPADAFREGWLWHRAARSLACGALHESAPQLLPTRCFATLSSMSDEAVPYLRTLQAKCTRWLAWRMTLKPTRRSGGSSMSRSVALGRVDSGPVLCVDENAGQSPLHAARPVLRGQICFVLPN